MSDKTEEPTPRRLKRAREQGDSGASAFASQSAAFLVAVALAPVAVEAICAAAVRDLRAALELARRAPIQAQLLEPWALAERVVLLVAPLLAAVGVAGVVVQALQTGGTVSFQRLAPNPERLNPIAGLAQIVSGTRLFSVARAFVTAAALAWITWGLLRDHAVDLARTTARTGWIGPDVTALAGALGLRAAVLGLALGGLDMLVVRRAWRRRLRMSPDEIKREHRDAEGDPQLKAARERAHHEALTEATVANVRGATVVVVNPTHLACALRYDAAAGDQAPVVVASGQGAFAERIMLAAHDFGVPVVRDVPLARALIELQTGDAIPEALYETVAEILREIDGRHAGDGRRASSSF